MGNCQLPISNLQFKKSLVSFGNGAFPLAGFN